MVTLVTGFFPVPDLDQPDLIKRYRDRAKFTLSRTEPMVVFCTHDISDFVISMRKNLDTQIYTLDLDELPTAKRVHDIQKNRAKNQPHYPDPRNTPWYFAITTAKFWMMQQATKSNPFKTDYFMWLDFGYVQADATDEWYLCAINTLRSGKRDLFSCCLIDYYSRRISITNPREYYQCGRCTLAAGVMTWHKDYLEPFASLVLDEYNKIIDLGYGHAEQQLMWTVYLQNPECIQIYTGDYPCLLKNYSEPRDTSTTTSCLLPRLLESRDPLLKTVVEYLESKSRKVQIRNGHVYIS